jgi:hypothetical protein
MSNTHSTPLFVVQCKVSGAWWIKNEGFAANCKSKATKMTFKEANQIALQFWRAGTNQEPVSA